MNSFDATHEDTATCGPYPHGHLFEVEAWGDKDLAEPLAVVVSELHNRQLAKMMNGGSQTGDGIARWVLERLMVTNPEVDGVSVAFRAHKFTVERERR